MSGSGDPQGQRFNEKLDHLQARHPFLYNLATGALIAIVLGLIGFDWWLVAAYALAWACVRAYLWGEGASCAASTRSAWSVWPPSGKPSAGVGEPGRRSTGRLPAACTLAVAMVIRLSVLLAVLVLAAGCSGGGDDDDDGATLGSTGPPTEVTAPDLPAPSPPGTGVVVVGGTTSAFSVTDCELQPEGADATNLLVVTGAGTTASGIPFQVEVQRFAADSAVAETFTDTITYSDTARILQVQRSEVDGEVSDLRDPDARSTLLRVRPDGLSAAGLAGPPGTGGEFDEGIVGFALDATVDRRRCLRRLLELKRAACGRELSLGRPPAVGRR